MAFRDFDDEEMLITDTDFLPTKRLESRNRKERARRDSLGIASGTLVGKMDYYGKLN
jgi:hypothetical protein